MTRTAVDRKAAISSADAAECAGAPPSGDKATLGLTKDVACEWDLRTGRFDLLQALAAELDDAHRFHASCGFLLIAIDDLARLNEACAQAGADQMIAAVVQCLRAKMRGQDTLGRFAADKLGVVLRDCTSEDLAAAAGRLLDALRENITIGGGAIAATVSIGGVAAPRYGRTVGEILSRAQDALDVAQAGRRGSFVAYDPSVKREAHRPVVESPAAAGASV